MIENLVAQVCPIDLLIAGRIPQGQRFTRGGLPVIVLNAIGTGQSIDLGLSFDE